MERIFSPKGWVKRAVQSGALNVSRNGSKGQTGDRLSCGFSFGEGQSGHRFREESTRLGRWKAVLPAGESVRPYSPNPQDLHATVFHALGAGTPDLSRNTGLSRPSFTTGKPVMGLFG